jgi:hypothetical protein
MDTTMTFPKIVESSHYHLWTDALHARALAKQAKNRWDRGTYVRWSVTTAWTVLEMACEEALETTGIGRRFKENLDHACVAKGGGAINWGSGVWQRVTALHEARKDFVHINATQEKLFPEFGEADDAISIVRDAATDIFARAGKSCPSWLRDDDDKGWDHGSQSRADVSSVHLGVDPQGEDTIRISYEYKGREYDSNFLPPGTDHEPYIRGSDPEPPNAGRGGPSVPRQVVALRAEGSNAWRLNRKCSRRSPLGARS